jgi:hypothetical protein
VERDKPKLESVGQTLPQLPWKQKRGDIKKNWIPLPFLKNQPLKAQLYMAYDIPTLLQGFIKFDQGISEKRDGQN